jgi:hypothetical protein
MQGYSVVARLTLSEEIQAQEEISPKKTSNMLRGGTVTQQQKKFGQGKMQAQQDLYSSMENCRPNKEYNMTSRKIEAQQEK